MFVGRSPEEKTLLGEEDTNISNGMADNEYAQRQRRYKRDMARHGRHFLKKHHLKNNRRNRQTISNAVTALQTDPTIAPAMAPTLGAPAVSGLLEMAGHSWKKHGRYLAEKVHRKGANVSGLWDNIKKAFTPDAAKVLATLVVGPAAGVATGLVSNALKGSGGSQKKEIVRTSKQPASSAPTPDSAPESETATGIGADVRSRKEIMNYIRREPNPLKRERMIINMQRAQGG